MPLSLPQPSGLHAELQASEQRYRAFFENAGIGIAHTDLAGRFVLANPKFCEITGFAADELLSKSLRDLLHPDDLAMSREYDARLVDKTLSPHAVERRYRRKDGEQFYGSVTTSLVRDASRNPTYFIHALQDMTDRRRMEDAVRRSEAKFRALIEHASDGIFMTDPQGAFLLVNSRYCEMVGYSEQELLGMNVAETFPGPERDQFRQRIGELQEIKSRLYERMMRRKDGSCFPVEINVQALSNGTNQGIARDITERRRTEQLMTLQHAVARRLADAGDAAEGLKAAMRAVCEAEGWECGRYLGVDERSGALRLAEAWGVEDPLIESFIAGSREVTYGPGVGLAGRVWQSGEPLWIADLDQDSREVQKALARELGLHGAFFFPVISQGRTVGVLAFNCRSVREPEERLLQVIGAIGNQIGQFVVRTTQQARIARLNRVYAVLSGINTLIVRVTDRQELCREACRIAVEAGQLRLAWIGIVDPRREEVVPSASSGPEEGLLGVIRLSTREDSSRFGMAGRAIRDRVAAVSNDLLADKGSRLRGESARRGFRSLAMIPLIIDGEAFGVLGLHAVEAGFFNQDEMKLLTELAGNIAFAFEHIAKEEKVRRLTRVNAVLSGINSLIVRVRDRGELFREACRISVEVGQFPKAWIGVVEPDSNDVSLVSWHGADALFFEKLAAALSKDAAQVGIVAQAIRERRAVISNDLEHDARVLGREYAVATGSRSLVALPLVVANGIAGVLVLHADVPGFFDDEEMKLLLELAGDISFALEHIKKSEQVEYLAYYDALTGLANSTLFRERLEQHIVAAANAQRSFALVVVNVDRFRAINDAFGRHTGDELLKQIAERFVIAAGDSNRLARTGADHFAYVGTTAQSEEEVARRTDSRLNQWFGSPYRVGANELRVSVTAGIAMFPNDGTHGDELLKNAEAALKKAKATGERYLFFEQQMTERIAENLSLENKLRQALEKDEFVLHYQPKVDLETGAVVGVEALIRWQSPERGLVPPAQFIPLLEETGLILQVGSWALKRAALDHRSWVEQGLNAPRVAVNVSAIQLRQRDFVSVVEQAIHEGVAPTGIDLEITESLIMDDVKGNIEKLNAVRKLDVTIAIDDFGTGHSSLGYLAKLPVQSVKIDRSFIITMNEDPNAMTLVSTIISLAHSLRLKVVAEGVETDQQAQFLRLLRCDQMQGYLFSKPLPAEQLVPLLQNKGS